MRNMFQVTSNIGTFIIIPSTDDVEEAVKKLVKLVKHNSLLEPKSLKIKKINPLELRKKNFMYH